MKRTARTLGNKEGPGCLPSRLGKEKVIKRIKIPRAMKIPPPT
jgi:hypothetical protein